MWRLCAGIFQHRQESDDALARFANVTNSAYAADLEAVDDGGGGDSSSELDNANNNNDDDDDEESKGLKELNKHLESAMADTAALSSMNSIGDNADPQGHAKDIAALHRYANDPTNIGQAITNYKSKWRQNLDLRCVFLAAPVLSVLGAKTRLESSSKKN